MHCQELLFWSGILGGRILSPGVYRYATSAALTGALILAGTGSCNDAWYFSIGSTLINAAGSSVVITGGAPGNVFWKVDSSTTVRAGSNFIGNILAAVSVILNVGSMIEGSLFALGVSITLNFNTIQPASAVTCPSISSSAQSSTSSGATSSMS